MVSIEDVDSLAQIGADIVDRLLVPNAANSLEMALVLAGAMGTVHAIAEHEGDHWTAELCPRAYDDPPPEDDDYVTIASTLQKLCDTYGKNMVLAVFANDMPTYYQPCDREPRHHQALRQARATNRRRT
jgi:hypothetical protein